MKDIPFETAKKFCEEYQKDQCIIISWDKTSGTTWVTTFGVGDTNSIQAATGGEMLKDYLKIKRERQEIPERFKDWAIESVARYYFHSGRNSKTYVELTLFYEKHTMERREEKRSVDIYDGQEYSLPDWAKIITARNRSLEPII